jgi:hypothetical protein
MGLASREQFVPVRLPVVPRHGHVDRLDLP